MEVLAAGLLLFGVIVPPQPVTVDVLSVDGEGCAPGTAVVMPSLDNTAFTVGYNGIAATDYRGFASLESGAKATQKAGLSYITMDTTDSSVSAQFKLTWKKC